MVMTVIDAVYSGASVLEIVAHSFKLKNALKVKRCSKVQMSANASLHAIMFACVCAWVCMLENNTELFGTLFVCVYFFGH